MEDTMEDKSDLDLLEDNFQKVINELKAAREQLKSQIHERVCATATVTNALLEDLPYAGMHILITDLKQKATQEAVEKGYELNGEPLLTSTKPLVDYDATVYMAKQPVLLTPLQKAELKIEQLEKQVESLESRLEENDD